MGLKQITSDIKFKYYYAKMKALLNVCNAFPGTLWTLEMIQHAADTGVVDIICYDGKMKFEIKPMSEIRNDIRCGLI